MKVTRCLASIGIAILGSSLVVLAACGGDDASSLGAHGGGGGNGGGDGGVTDGTVGAADSPYGSVPEAGPDTALPPLNAEDAADVPDGGARIDPGIVACPTSSEPCTVFAQNQCCLDPTGGDASVCQSTAVSCAPGAPSLACDESADCFVGTVCCATFAPTDAGGFVLSTKCQATCGAAAMLCKTNGECGDAGCVIQNCSDGVSHEICGAYAMDGGAFACTPQ